MAKGLRSWRSPVEKERRWSVGGVEGGRGILEGRLGMMDLEMVWKAKRGLSVRKKIGKEGDAFEWLIREFESRKEGIVIRCLG
jgi:hypothetical protein